MKATNRQAIHIKLVYVFTFFVLALTIYSCDSDKIQNQDVGFDLARSDAMTSDASLDVLPDTSNNPDLKTDAMQNDMNANCESGCIVEREFIGTFLRHEIRDLLPDGVKIANGYSIFWITYKTNGRLARASVTVPDGVSIPEAGWPIAVNNPGTVGVADACAIAFSLAGSGLSGYFGARGFVGVTIDYPGLATAGKHVYLSAEIEGKASLDAVRATKNLLAAFEIPHSGAAIIAGLSQGGHATLAAAALQKEYAPELDIRAYAAAGPASVFLEHWQPGIQIDGPQLAYHAMLTYAWQAEYGGGENPWTTEISGGVDAIMEEHCNYPTDLPSLDEVLGSSNGAIFNQAYIDAFAAGNFENYSFMEEGFSRNRLRGFETDVPIRIYQGDLDDVVLRTHTDELVAELKTLNPNLEYITVADGSHTDIAFSFLAVQQLRTDEVISWLKERVQ